MAGTGVSANVLQLGLNATDFGANGDVHGAAALLLHVVTLCRLGSEAGTLGYLLKDAPAAALADAVRRVHAGLRAIDPDLAAQAWGEADPLSDRERQVLRLAGEGHTGAEIAEAIGKLGAANRVEAARIAREQGKL